MTKKKDENKIKITIEKEGEFGGTEKKWDSLSNSDGETPKEEASSPADSADNSKEKKEKNLTGAMVLLVDDDDLILQMYQKKLKHDGYRVETASNGNDAILIAKDKQPFVIFLDVVMAEMNGAEVLKELKKEPKTKNIPVIMLTNFSDKDEDIKSAKKFGALDYLIKAEIDPNALSRRVKQLIDTGK